MSKISIDHEPTPEQPKASGKRGRLRWLGSLLGQESVLKPVFQGIGMTSGAVIVAELGGNLSDIVYVGVLGGFVAGTVAGEVAVAIRRSVIANN